MDSLVVPMDECVRRRDHLWVCMRWRELVLLWKKTARRQLQLLEPTKTKLLLLQILRRRHAPRLAAATVVVCMLWVFAAVVAAAGGGLYDCASPDSSWWPS